jgi:phosphate transport system permease protein
MSVTNISHSLEAKSPDLSRRHLVARIWNNIFFFSTVIGIVALSLLLLSVINQAVGLVAIEYTKAPATLSSQPLESLDSTELIAILQKNISKNRVKLLEREKPLFERSQKELYELVMNRVVDPQVVGTWHLDQSIFNRPFIEAETASKHPNARLEYRSWLNAAFLSNAMDTRPELAGIRTALLGSIYLILITILFAFPIGVGAAVYLEEYADKTLSINRMIQLNIDNLAGVPSIVYGILGLAIFVRAFSFITSGVLFGQNNANGRTILSAGLTMGLLVLPILIINAQEAIRSVPSSLRQASYGLGATKWQTIWAHVLPAALPGILTGTILAISRAIGETAPLIVVGASTFITQDPNGPFAHFTALPIQIYNWTTRPQDEFRNIAAAAILVLLILLLSLNAAAILLRNRFSKR